jgi:hypothetical protein
MLPEISIGFSGDHFRNLLAIALLVSGMVLNWLYYFRWRSDSATPYLKWLFLLRTTAIAMVAFLLLAPVIRIGLSRSVEPSFIFLIDRSLSMTLPTWEEGAGEEPRIESVKEQLNREDLLGELRSMADIDFYIFSEQQYPVDPDSILLEERETASGRTDIAGALKWVMENEPMADAIFVVTDGRINTGEDPRSLLKGEIPIFFLGVGEDVMNDDVDIKAVKVPERVYEGSPIPFAFTLNSRLTETSRVNFQLSEGEVLLKTIALELKAGEFFRDVEFSIDEVGEGRHVYRASVEGLEGENFVENNKRRAIVDVLATKKNVLVISATPRWDLSFFVKALRDLEYLSVDLFLFRPEKEEGIFLTDRNKVTDHLPFNDLDLEGYDLLCLQGNLDDVPVSEFSEAFPRISQPGKGVIILFTDRLQEILTLNHPFRELLPRSFPEAFSIVEGRFDIMPPVADPSGLTRLLHDNEGNLSVWSSLPPLFGRANWFPDRVSKIDAETLVSVRGERGEEFPAVVAVDRNGFRVVAFMGRGFWRWSFHRTTPEETGHYYREFIDSLVGWIFDGSDKSTEVRLSPAKSLFLRGDEVEFILRGGTSAGEKAYLVIGPDIEGASADSFSIASEGHPGDTEIFSIHPLNPGDYRYFYGTQGKGISGEGHLHVDTYSKEYSNPQPDDRLLKELGSTDNGTYINIDHFDREKFGQILAQSKNNKHLVKTFVMHKHPILYLVLLLTLISELTLRKMKGYP